MPILVLDNYDSFTYNLVQYLRELTAEPVSVYRNDEISLEDVAKFDPIVLSPGPGVPSDAGIMEELIRAYLDSKTILGVCLGHQAIAETLGGSLINLDQVYHGVATNIEVLKPSVIFGGLPSRFTAGRYHSWIVDSHTIPEELSITAVDENGLIMALEHKYRPVYGVQFHPESMLTSHGKELLTNFLHKYRETDSSLVLLDQMA
jgi:anthranilate synthase component 2